MKKGFTLVELSIVIVIIGFLVAGISAGSQLVEQARLRAFISMMDSLKQEYDEFKLIYNGVPGDFYNASAYWPNCAVGGAGNINCNGNGNGLIEMAPSTTYPGVDIEGELFRVFRHLNMSGINVIGGNETIASNWSWTSQGVTSAGNPDLNGITLNYITADTGGYVMHVGVNTPLQDLHTGMFFVKVNTPHNEPKTGVLPPSKAFQIDQKIDDGAVVGTQFSGAGNGNFGVTANTTIGEAVCQVSGDYTMTNTTVPCIIAYKIETF